MIWLKIGLLGLSLWPIHDNPSSRMGRCERLISDIAKRTVNMHHYEGIEPVMSEEGTQILKGYANLRSRHDGHQIRDRLPTFAREMLGKYSGRFGPNCWNASCNFYRPSTGIRRFEADEMVDIIARDFVDLPIRVQLQFGDLISFWMKDSDDSTGKKMNLTHTMVYIDGEFIFHKATINQDSPYVLDAITRALSSDDDQYSDGNEYTDEIRFHRPKPEMLASMHGPFSRAREDVAARMEHFLDGNPRMRDQFP